MLFKDTATLLKYTGVVTSVKLTDVNDTIVFVEEKILQKLLGPDQYKELNDEYTQQPNEEQLSNEKKELLEYCRRLLGPYICYYYQPKAAIQVSSAGSQRVEAEKTKTSFARQDAAFREQYLLQGESASETLLAYLFKEKKQFPSWCKTFEKYNELFIKSGSEFDEYYTSSQPFRNYWAMRFKMVDVEQLTIEVAIQTALFDYLKEKEKEEGYEWTDEEKKLLFMLKKAIAYFTIASALPHINARIDENGITVTSDGTGGISDKEKRKAASDTALSWTIKNCNEAGSNWLSKAKKFIADNAEKFAAWEAPSKCKPGAGNECLEGAFGLV